MKKFLAVLQWIFTVIILGLFVYALFFKEFSGDVSSLPPLELRAEPCRNKHCFREQM
jgi:hypothetical protein